MTIDDVQFSWIPSVCSDNDRYVTHNKTAEGLSAVDIWIRSWPTPEDLRACWDAYQERLADIGITNFIIRDESIDGASRTRIYRLRKNIAQMSLPTSVSKFIEFDGVLTCEHDADFIASAMPLMRGVYLHSFDDFLRQTCNFYLIAIEQGNINLLQRFIETHPKLSSGHYDLPNALFDFLRSCPAIGLCALGYADDREKSVLALGSEKTLKRFMNI